MRPPTQSPISVAFSGCRRGQKERKGKVSVPVDMFLVKVLNIALVFLFLWRTNGLLITKNSNLKPVRDAFSLRSDRQTSRRHLVAAIPNPIGSEVAAAILVPSSLGFWRREYGVSYGYGLSVAGAAYVAFKKASTSLGKAHALLHITYGLRLSAYLFLRESTVPKFKRFRDKIEEKAPQSRLARTPFIVSCAALYWWMSFPVLITSSLLNPLKNGSFISNTVIGCLIVAAIGLSIQILGDTQKYFAKSRDDKALVDGGIYSILRHPNYTGELFLWIFSSLAGILAVPSAFGWTWRALFMIAGTLLGAVGISFVLALATTGLEKRQLETYGRSEAFNRWRMGTWAGITLPATVTPGPTDNSKAHVSNELDAEEQNC